jgi:hypothetical protein
MFCAERLKKYAMNLGYAALAEIQGCTFRMTVSALPLR